MDQKVNESVADLNIPRTPGRFFVFMSAPHKWWAIAAFTAVFLAQVAEIAAIYVVSQLIDNFSGVSGKEEQLEVLIYWGVWFVGLGILDRICWRASGFTGLLWAIKANKTAYDSLYKYLLNHSHNYFINRFAGALSNKVSNAADGSADIVLRFLWNAWPEIVSLVVTLWLFFNIHWLVGLVSLVVFILITLFNIWFVRMRRPYVVTYSKASSDLRGKGVDLIGNVSAVRQYARVFSELMSLQAVTEDRARKDRKQAFLGEGLMVSNGIFSLMLTIVILVMVYVLLDREMATAGQLVLVLILLSRVSFTFNSMGNIMNGLIRRYGEVEEGLKEIIVPLEILDVRDSEPLQVASGEIVWKDVTFDFASNRIFNKFDLTIAPGQRMGLVGPSGAGKTTFVSLLLRQHDLTSGAITIDGQDISKITQDSLRANVAVVPQEPALFHRTIRENIAYGKPDATEEEIIAVAKKAQAHSFITDLPGGYDTLVGERGVKLSGGQKQRIAIARAMLKDAPILVLDEATSALDSESEVAIQKALHILMEGKTVIAIAHRLSTLREMDRIVVLENGSIIEDGTHSTLKNSGGVYERLWNHQAGGFVGE